MDDLTRARLVAQLNRDEGRRNRVYTDATGHATIGIGHNLERPISDFACDVILRDDIKDTEAELVQALPWILSLSPARLGALVNLAFNVGVQGLLGFQKALVAIEAQQWAVAARELLDSRWAEQVGARALRIAEQIRTDTWR